MTYAAEMLAASGRAEAEITHELYEEHRALREKLFEDLCRRHDDLPRGEVLGYAQTILDRVLFIAFAEGRGLLPAGALADRCNGRGKLAPAPVWKSLCALFRWIDEGHEAPRLFRDDANIDALDVTDEMCAELLKLCAHDYRDGVSVEALGHIFERSITDLEELRGSSGVSPPARRRSRRKVEGVFYTPASLARFIVDQTLGRLFDERWREVAVARGPHGRRLEEGSAAWTAAWLAVHEAYREELTKLRVLDLSCGAGVFLIAAFEALSREYGRVNAKLAELSRGQASLFDTKKTVLTHNLFGVDINAESVEMTQLSLWLKAAEPGQKLTYLAGNIKWGNSIVKDPTLDVLAFDWQTGEQVKSAFAPPQAPEAAEIHARWREGFDVVIGNPPYVRHELLGKIKGHLEENYRAYHGMADLYVYFFERGLSVLKPGGRLGLLVANKWLKAGYAEALRALLAKETRVETIIDFGHAPIFPDADTSPCIVTLTRPKDARASALEPHDVQVTMFPREALAATAVADHVMRHRYAVPQSRLGGGAWSLEPPLSDALFRKIVAEGAPLTDFAGAKPFRGIVTGLNEAFIIDERTRRRLIDEDPRSGDLLKKHVRGQDVGRWSSAWSGSWLIFARRGVDMDAYPAVKRHLSGHRDALEPRPREGAAPGGAGRKPGSYRWYEIQDPVDYWQIFQEPKLLYQEIQFHPAYALDEDGLFPTNKVFVLPKKDLWLLAVLNSPLMWWYCWRYLPHMKDETLSPVGARMESLPIARPSAAAREEAERAVTRLLAIARAENEARAAVLDSLRMQFNVAEPGHKLSDLASLDADAFVKEVLKRRPRAAGKRKAADLKALREMYSDEALPLQARRREALSLERRLSSLVNGAYRLTPEEEALLWSTAPPRMPFKPA